MKYWLPNEIYDAIKFIVTVVMPAVSVLYVGLAAIWGWPYSDEIARTIAVVYTFLCAILGISTYTAKPAVGPDDTADLGKHLGE